MSCLQKEFWFLESTIRAESSVRSAGTNRVSGINGFIKCETADTLPGIENSGRSTRSMRSSGIPGFISYRTEETAAGIANSGRSTGLARYGISSKLIQSGLNRLWILMLLVASLSAGMHCVYGTVGDSEETNNALTSFLLGSARTDLQLELRFTDGGSDAIDQFSSGGAAIDLSSLSIEVQEVEVFYEPGLFQGIISNLLYLHKSGELMAHGEEETSGTGSFRTPGGTFQLTGFTGTDAGGRNYQALTLNLQVPPGDVKTVRLHIGQITATGTTDANPFATVSNDLADTSTSLNCTLDINLNQSVSRPLLLNFGQLFADGTGATAIRNRVSSSTFLQETECFVI